MKNTASKVKVLSAIENINRGGCGLAALVIGNALKKDGLTPQYFSETSIKEFERFSGFEHIVVGVKETGLVMDAEGTVKGPCKDYYTQHEIPEEILRKVVRHRPSWNRAFDRRSLLVLRYAV
jgi:hypothetical protein